MDEQCLICGSKSSHHPEQYIQCERCGDYIANFGNDKIDNPDIQVRLSGWIRDQNRFGDKPTITPDVVNRVGKIAIPGFRRRADNLLLEIARLNPDYTGRISDSDLYAPRSQA